MKVIISLTLKNLTLKIKIEKEKKKFLESMSFSPIELATLKERLETVEKKLELMKSGVSFKFNVVD